MELINFITFKSVKFFQYKTPQGLGNRIRGFLRNNLGDVDSWRDRWKEFVNYSMFSGGSNYSVGLVDKFEKGEGGTFQYGPCDTGQLEFAKYLYGTEKVQNLLQNIENEIKGYASQNDGSLSGFVDASKAKLNAFKAGISFGFGELNALGAIGGIQSYELKVIHYQQEVIECTESYNIVCNIEVTLSDYYGNGKNDLNHNVGGVASLTLLQHHPKNCDDPTVDNPFIHRVTLNHKFVFQKN